MTNIINPNDKRYMVPNSGLKQADLQGSLQKSKQAVTENVSDNSIAKTMRGDSDPATRNTKLALVPILYAGDMFINKTMGGEKGLLGHAADLGDKISHALHLDGLLSQGTGTKISDFLKNNRFTKYFTSDFKAIPKSSMAKGQKMAEKYTGELKEALSSLANIDGLTDALANNTTPLKDQTINVLTALKDGSTATGVSPQNMLDAVDDLIAAGADKLPQKGLLSKPTVLSEVRNKFKAASMQTGKTGLGKLFAKGTLKTKDVLTYGGGLLSMFFLAGALVNAVKATKEAPEGEKKSTFMHVLSEQFMGMILFQPSINLLYKIGGNKYRGMTKEGRQALANLVSTSNSQVLSKDAMKIANIQKKLLIKGVDNNKVANLAGKSLKEVKTAAKSLGKEGAKLKFWEKPLKFMGRILSAGLDKIKKPWIVKGKKIPHPTLKGFAGGALRFALIMFVIQPLLQKPLTNLSHKLFGEPKAYLAKQKQQSEDKNSKEPNINEMINENPQSTNVLQMWNEKQKHQSAAAATSLPLQQDSTPIKPQGDNNALAASKINNSQGRYIPTVDFEFPPEDDTEINQRADAILKSSDKAIKRTMDVLQRN
jgi:hypothetical protein